MPEIEKKYDIIFVLPYVFSDHPSFPEGILKRALEAAGFSVGVIETPFWQKPESFSVRGEPKLFFAIIAGPVDSVVLNYTSTRKRRIEDQYQKEGKSFFDGYPMSIKYKIRPDLATVVFANRLRQLYKTTPIVIGGMEAAQRRFVHFDFQKEQLKRSILFDSRADLLVTGPGEKQMVEIARLAREGAVLNETDVPGTARLTKDSSAYPGYLILPSLEVLNRDRTGLMNAALKVEKARIAGKGLIQVHDNRMVVDHPPGEYTAKDLDTVYGLDYSRLHTSYKKLTPALEMNLFSVTSHRGCGGGCTFCSISVHEGKHIISRSASSILDEIKGFADHPRWQGIVSDIGGATAEMYGTDCSNNSCKRLSCLSKKLCPQLGSTATYLELLRQARALKSVRKIFLGSGIRYDLVLENPELLEEILVHHSGRYLRVAPEHTEENVLDLMRKPRFGRFEAFVELFNQINSKLKRKIELAPYLIIGHPGETFRDIKQMQRRLKQLRLKTTDVQLFTPTPGTISTAMYYSKVSPDFKEIPVETSIKELVKRKHFITKS